MTATAAGTDYIATLLQLSLAQWSIPGEVKGQSDESQFDESQFDNKQADNSYTLSTADHVVTVKRAPTGLPFRWIVVSAEQRRTASSIVGLLRHVRLAIGASVQPMSMNFAAPVGALGSSNSPGDAKSSGAFE